METLTNVAILIRIGNNYVGENSTITIRFNIGIITKNVTDCKHRLRFHFSYPDLFSSVRYTRRESKQLLQNANQL